MPTPPRQSVSTAPTCCLESSAAAEVSAAPRPARPRGFTLIELLVVIALIAVLAALLLPALAGARDQGRKAGCLSNLHQMGIAIHNYASDNSGNIPFGPKAPAFTSPSDFYPSTGAPTSLLSLRTGPPVGLGLMLNNQLADQPKVLFCPGSDEPVDAALQLSYVGVTQAQSSYYYRHGGITQLFDPPGVTVTSDHLRLEDLGTNSYGQPIRALVIDTLMICPPALAAFNVKPATSHHQKFADILFSDGHAAGPANTTNRFLVDLTDYNTLRYSFNKILGVLENADAIP